MMLKETANEMYKLNFYLTRLIKMLNVLKANKTNVLQFMNKLFKYFSFQILKSMEH